LSLHLPNFPVCSGSGLLQWSGWVVLQYEVISFYVTAKGQVFSSIEMFHVMLFKSKAQGVSQLLKQSDWAQIQDFK